jgi:GH25 family lysozyme M1 (1,4-beta-N-acetylmuramidase)
MSIEGVDVSGANGSNIDWHKVHASGRHFAVCKVNEGDLIEGTTSGARIDAIRNAGMVPGGYDFVHPKPGRTGAQEFHLHWNAARHVGLYKTGDMRPVIDFEASSYGSDSAGVAHTLAYVRSWIDECYKVCGKHPILYTGFFWRDHCHDPNDTMHCQLWYPSYPSLTAVPRAWGKDRVTIHQYSEKGTVPGIQGHVDLDRYLTNHTGTAATDAFRNDLCL